MIEVQQKDRPEKHQQMIVREDGAEQAIERGQNKRCDEGSLGAEPEPPGGSFGQNELERIEGQGIILTMAGDGYELRVQNDQDDGRYNHPMREVPQSPE